MLNGSCSFLLEYVAVQTINPYFEPIVYILLFIVKQNSQLLDVFVTKSGENPET